MTVRQQREREREREREDLAGKFKEESVQDKQRAESQREREQRFAWSGVERKIFFEDLGNFIS